MPKIMKVKNVNVMCWTQAEVDRIPNVGLGKNCRVMTNNILINNKKLSKFINNNTMGALDNYANQEGLSIYITPLENDLFHDVAVSVYKEHNTLTKFAMKIDESRAGFHDFIKELYEKIAPKQNSKPKKLIKPTKFDDFKMFIGDKIAYIKNLNRFYPN